LKDDFQSGSEQSLLSKRLISNSTWNIVAFACGLAAQFITVPFVIRWISLEGFGRAGLVLAVWAPMMLIGTVLGQATTREMSVRLGAGNLQAALRVLDTSMLVCLCACMIGGVAFSMAGPALLTAFVADYNSFPALQSCFIISGIGWAAQQVVLLLQGACSARQDFHTMAKVAAFSALSTVMLTLGCTALFPSVQGYLGGIALSFVAVLLAWLWVFRSVLISRHWWMTWHRDEFASLLRFGKWQTMAQLAGTIGNQIDRYVLGMLAPAVVIGQYNAANRLQEAAYIGVLKAGEILFPHFGATAQDEITLRARFFLTSSWVMGTLSAMILAPLIPLSHSLLTLWVGPETAEGGSLLLRTLVLGGLIGCGSNIFGYYAMGIGQNAPVAWLSVLYSFLTVIATVTLMSIYGAYAAGTGLLVASIVRVALSIWLIHNRFFVSMRYLDLIVSSLLPLAAGIGVALLLFIVGAGQVSGWYTLILFYTFAAVVVLVVVLLLTVPWRVGREILTRLRYSLQ
jgi:O-antigen/teichoic acid export membrane protein